MLYGCWKFYLYFLRSLHTIFHSGCIILYSYPSCVKDSTFSAFLPTLAVFCFVLLIIFIWTGSWWYLIEVFISVSLMISDNEHFSPIYLLVICKSSLDKCLKKYLAHFQIGFLDFLLLSSMNSLYIYEINILSNLQFSNIFTQSVVLYVHSVCSLSSRAEDY